VYNRDKRINFDLNKDIRNVECEAYGLSLRLSSRYGTRCNTGNLKELSVYYLLQIDRTT